MCFDLADACLGAVARYVSPVREQPDGADELLSETARQTGDNVIGDPSAAVGCAIISENFPFIRNLVGSDCEKD